MPELGRFARELRARLWKPSVDEEVASELSTHLALLEQDLIARGMTPAAARAQARAQFGDVGRIEEECRDVGVRRDRERKRTEWVSELRQDFRYALRQLRTSARFTAIAVLTLAIGIGGTTAVFSAVDAVLLQPLPYEAPGQLVRVYQYDAGYPDDRGFVTPVHFVEFRSRVSSFESLAATLTYSASGADIGVGDDARRISLLPVSAEYFDVLRVRPTAGRGFERADETGTSNVVISHALWKSLGSDRAAIGSALTMSGKAYTIVGILPDGFADPISPSIDAWVPIDMTPGRNADNAGNHYLTLIGRVRTGTPLARAEADLERVALQLAKDYPGAASSRARLYPLKEDITSSSSRALQVMLGAVGLVLVLVCVNIANLLLVRGTERAREFALRSALGAARGRLVRQLLIESLTLAAAGALAGLVVARIAMSAIVYTGRGSIPRLATLTLEPRLLGFAIAIGSLCALAFGLLPAMRATRAQPSETLRSESRGATGGGAAMRLRDGLVVAQVALALMLLVGAGLLVASVQRIRSVDLGVRTDHALAFELHLPDARYDSLARARAYETIATALERIPGVQAAGGVSKLPATGDYHQWPVRAASGPQTYGPGQYPPSQQQRVVSGDYFKAAGIPLVSGRLFDARDDATAPPRAIISKSLETTLFPGRSAVGQHIIVIAQDLEVIGVVGDVSLDTEGRLDGYVYHAHAQFAGDRNWALTQLVRTTGSLDALQGAARRAIAAIDPQLVLYQPMPFADVIGQGEAQRTFTVRLLASFALVALSLAALGLFGVLSYGVRLRRREFGIRMALGAGGSNVRRMVLGRGMMLVTIGTVIGLAGAVAAARVMQSLVFRVSPLDPVVLATSVGFMMLVAAIAAYVPALRATRVDPKTILQ